MKKTKLLSLVLTAALVLTTVFAGTESIFAADSQEMQAKSTEQIDAVSLNSNVTAETWTVSYDKNNTVYIPVYIPTSGTFKIDLAGIDYQYGSYIKLKNGATADAGAIGSSKYISSSTPEGVIFAEVSKGGTYYLEFSTTLSGSYKTAFRVSYAPAGGTIKSGTEFFGTSLNGKVSYYKITAAGTGYLKVAFPSTASSYPSYSIKLMNSKKKSISGDYQYVSSSKNYTTYFGVGKGTYYIAVKTSDPMYGIKTTYTKVSENSGSTKSKAKSIYKKGTKKGIITAAQSSTSGDWYKFKVTKTQTVKFSVSTLSSSNGGLKISFYKSGSSYAFGSQSFSSYYSPSGTIQPYTYGYGKKLSPGTYYIKVQKYSSGNGYYKMKWL